MLDAARAAGARLRLIGGVNRRMPFMTGDAVLADGALRPPARPPALRPRPFCPPNLPIRGVEHAIGLNAAALVRDGGTLQLGIGELGDACVYALQLRQQRNDAVPRGARRRSASPTATPPRSRRSAGSRRLERGLYACTEMFVDGFLDLYRTGILSRRVYPHAVLQRLLDAGEDQRARRRRDAGRARARRRRRASTRAGFAALEARRAVPAGHALRGTGQVDRARTARAPRRRASTTPAARAALAEHCLSRRLDGGRRAARRFLPRAARLLRRAARTRRGGTRRFDMTRISYTNSCYGADYALKVAQRRHARFINTTMMVHRARRRGLGRARQRPGRQRRRRPVQLRRHGARAARGALDPAGAQHAHHATARTTSNLVWNYGHTTIPRHLRDVVVTEYGVAHAARPHRPRLRRGAPRRSPTRASRRRCSPRRSAPARSSRATGCPTLAATRPRRSTARLRRCGRAACSRTSRSAPTSRPRRSCSRGARARSRRACATPRRAAAALARARRAAARRTRASRPYLERLGLHEPRATGASAYGAARRARGRGATRRRDAGRQADARRTRRSARPDGAAWRRNRRGRRTAAAPRGPARRAQQLGSARASGMSQAIRRQLAGEIRRLPVLAQPRRDARGAADRQRRDPRRGSRTAPRARRTRASSAPAVFLPMPGTPGMLSTRRRSARGSRRSAPGGRRSAARCRRSGSARRRCSPRTRRRRGSAATGPCRGSRARARSPAPRMRAAPACR